LSGESGWGVNLSSHLRPVILGMSGALPLVSILLILYRLKTLHLHNTEIFYTEFYSVESERVVCCDEAESCIVGSICFGNTSATSEVVLWARQYLDRFHC